MPICNNKKCSLGKCDQLETCAAYVPVITNADRIRAMSDEELALFIRAIIHAEGCPIIGGECNKCFLKELCFNGPKWDCKETEWLQQPAEGE